MANVRRAARVGLPTLLAALALVVPATTSAGGPPHPTRHRDVLIGTPRSDVIAGWGGPDTIIGRAGDDALWGNAGGDRILGGPGMDRIYGGLGPDVLEGGRDADGIRGGPGNDIIITAGDEAIDKVSCGEGLADVAVVDADDVVNADCELVLVQPVV